MFSSWTKIAAFFSLLSLILSNPASGQMAGDSVNLQMDSLTVKADTLNVTQDTIAVRKDTLDIIVSSENLNTIPGFRVQIRSTQNLSEAIDERAKAESLLSDYNVYLIYDSPYYKVRAGDFRVRYDATQAANYMINHGFSGAWVVPDNIFKNPKPKNGSKDPPTQNR